MQRQRISPRSQVPSPRSKSNDSRPETWDLGLNLGASQAAILDAVRLVGVVSETAFAVFFVFAIIAVEILDF